MRTSVFTTAGPDFFGVDLPTTEGADFKNNRSDEKRSEFMERQR